MIGVVGNSDYGCVSCQSGAAVDFCGSGLLLLPDLEWRPLRKHDRYESARSPRCSPDIDYQFHLHSVWVTESDWFLDIRAGGSVSISFLVFDVHCAPRCSSLPPKAHLSRVGWALDFYSANVMRHPAASQLFYECHCLGLIPVLYMLELGSERHRRNTRLEAASTATISFAIAQDDLGGHFRCSIVDHD